MAEPSASETGGVGTELRELGKSLTALELVRENFDDPLQEWRRLFAEALGTFLLVLVGAGGGVVDAVSNGAIGRRERRRARPDGHGGHPVHGCGQQRPPEPSRHARFRPVRRLPLAPGPGYIVAELLGSTLAVLLLWATEPGPGISDPQAMFMEMILTVGLFSVILGTASGSRNLGPLSALVVGPYIVLAGLWSSPISGASMNPARSFGPDLVLGNFDHYWAYEVGPILGAVIAVEFALILRGRADVGGAAAAQGAVGPLVVGPDSATPGGAPGS